MRIIITVLILSAALCQAQTTAISGQVVDGAGTPVPSARVFIEPGLGGELVETATDTQGQFKVSGAFQGGVGVLALAPGLGFGGQHLNLAMGEAADLVRVVLEKAVSVSGTVANEKGGPVSGARIIRVALISPSKIGIPLAKLAALGIKEPVTDAKGQFILDNVPQASVIALKVGHSEYAQEAAESVAVGSGMAKIIMTRGVTVRGEVKSRQTQKTVSSAVVVIRNAQPPHDTSVSKTDGFGVFSTRLKPGVYLCQATAVGQITAGWQKITITGELPEVNINLGLAGTGSIKGSIADAVSGNSIEGARIRLESGGNVAAIVRTDVKGSFKVSAAEGENILFFEATPGFLPPEPRAMRVSVQPGGNVELPGMWLAPLPTYKLQVLDEDESTPVAGAVVTLLRPRQFGWLISDEKGWVNISIANLPADGRVVGFVEHPNKAVGGVFSLERGTSSGAAAKLVPFASVTGIVVDEKGKPVPDAVVGAAFPDSPMDDPLLLWRTTTDKEGRFVWSSVMAGVPQRCAVAGVGGQVESPAFNLAPKENKELGVLSVSGVAPKASVGSFNFAKWRAEKTVCGSVSAGDRPAVLVFCETAEAGPIIEGMGRALKSLGALRWDAALVVRGGYACADAPMPVITGTPPEAAATYLVGSDGKIIMRTFGLPPIHELVGVQ